MLSILLIPLLLALEETPKAVGVFYRADTDVESTDRHRDAFELMKAIGVDWVIPWLGEGSSDLGLVLDEVAPAARDADLAIVFYASLSWLKSLRDPPDTPERSVTDALLNAFAQRPNGPWALLNERVVLLLPRRGIVTDKVDFVCELRRRFRDELHVELHIIGDPSWKNEVDTLCRFGGSLLGPTTLGEDAPRCVTIGPGHDDTRSRVKGTAVRPREDGRFYQRAWHQVASNNIDIVFIESWNDTDSGTYIVPDLAQGYRYIDETESFIQTWKSGSRPKSPEPTLVWPTPIPREPRDLGWELRERAEVRFATTPPYSSGVIPIEGHYEETPYGRVLMSAIDGDRHTIGFDVAAPFYGLTRGPIEILIELGDDSAEDVAIQVDGEDQVQLLIPSDQERPSRASSTAWNSPELLGRIEHADIRLTSTKPFSLKTLFVKKTPRQGLGFTWELPLHSSDHESILDRVLEDFPWRAVRLLVKWEDLESGLLEFDSVVSAAKYFRERSLTVIVAMHSPPKAANVDGLIEVCSEIALLAKASIDGFEVLCHPNTAYGFAPEDFVDRYLALLRKFRSRIHAIDPALLILNGALFGRAPQYTALLAGGDRSLFLDALMIEPALPPLGPKESNLDSYMLEIENPNPSMKEALPVWFNHSGYMTGESPWPKSEWNGFFGRLIRFAHDYSRECDKELCVTIDDDSSFPSLGGVPRAFVEAECHVEGLKTNRHSNLSEPLDPHENPVFVWTHGEVDCVEKSAWLFDYVSAGGTLVLPGRLPGGYTYSTNTKRLDRTPTHRRDFLDRFWIGFADGVETADVPRRSMGLFLPGFLSGLLQLPDDEFPTSQFLIRRNGRPREILAESQYIPIIHTRDGHGDAAALYRFTKKGRGRVLAMTFDFGQSQVEEATQARYLLSDIEIARARGCPLCFVGTLFDSSPQGGLGLYRFDGTPKLAVEALQRLRKK